MRHLLRHLTYSTFIIFGLAMTSPRASAQGLAPEGEAEGASLEDMDREPAQKKSKSGKNKKTSAKPAKAKAAKAKAPKPVTKKKSAAIALPPVVEETTSSQPDNSPSASVDTNIPVDNAKSSNVDFSAKEVWDVDIFKDPSHKVLVIQDRKFTKAGRLELGLDGGTMNASPFYRTFTYGARTAYHFSEYYAAEAFFNASSGTLSKDGKQIDDFLKANNFQSVKEYQKPGIYGGVGLNWSPIYGKFAFFRKSIIHFDIFGLLGVSVMTSKSNVTSAGGKNQTHPGSLMGVGARVFLSNHFSLRADVRNNIYRSYFVSPSSATTGSTITRSAFNFNFGVSYLFGSGR